MNDKQLSLTSVQHREGQKTSQPTSNKAVNMSFRCSEAELEMIKRGAENDGQGVSAWIRSLAARRLEEQSAGIDTTVDSAIFPLIKALREFVSEEVERRTK